MWGTYHSPNAVWDKSMNKLKKVLIVVWICDMYNVFLRKIEVAWDNHAFSQLSPDAPADNRSIWHFSFVAHTKLMGWDENVVS